MLKQLITRNEARYSTPSRTEEALSRRNPKPKLTLKTLKKLIPLRNLGEDELNAFSLSREVEIFPKDTVLFNQGEPIDSIFYLLEGTVALEREGLLMQNLSADSFKAKFPLSSGKIHGVTVRAKTEVGILRVPTRILEMGNSNYHAHKVVLQNPTNYSDVENIDSNVLFHSFYNHFCEQKIALPTLPNVAIKLKNAMKRDIGIGEAAKIVQLDPSISAKIIQVANSPLYSPVEPVRSCLDAVKLLGLDALRSLVTSFSMKQVFQCDNKLIQKKMEHYWTQSIYLSSLCYLIASKVKKTDPGQALLAGLLCDIGVVPFLHFAANLPSDLYDENEIELAIPLVKTPVGVAILKKWGFSDEIAEIPATSEDWFRNTGDELRLSEIVLLAKLHSYIGKPKSHRLPFIETVPAFAKLSQQSLTPESSLEILNIANSRVRKVTNLFI